MKDETTPPPIPERTPPVPLDDDATGSADQIRWTILADAIVGQIETLVPYLHKCSAEQVRYFLLGVDQAFWLQARARSFDLIRDAMERKAGQGDID